MNASRLVFVSWDTGIIDRCDSDVVIVDLEAVGYVPDGDEYLDSGRVEELAREHGVPVADLWAAYQWRQKILTAMGMFDEWCPVGELSGDRHKYPASDGVVVPWDVAGDPRPGVECCRECAKHSGDDN